MKKIILILLLVLFSQHAFSAGWSSATKVLQVYSTSSGFVLINFGEMLDEGCGNTSWIYLNPAHNNFKAILAQLLMAQATQMNVLYYVSGCNSIYTNLTNFRTFTP